MKDKMKSGNFGLKRLLVMIGVSFILNSCVWQFGEVQLYRTIPSLIYKITGIPITAIKSFDESGVRTLVNSGNEVQYNPLFIARQALDDHQNLDEPVARSRFIAATDWLYENAVISDSIALWVYDFAMPRYNLEPGWSSALAQAVILEAIYERYTLEHDPKWLELSHGVLNSLLPGETGLCLVLAPDAYWFEEFPTDPPSYVFNGMNSILMQLDKHHKASGDSLAGLLFERGFKALMLRLPSYDKAGYTWHDGWGNVASRTYHWMHYHQLIELNEIRANEQLQHYSKRWRTNYYLVPVAVQLLINFKAMRALGFAVSWLGFFVLILLLWLVYRRLYLA